MNSITKICLAFLVIINLLALNCVAQKNKLGLEAKFKNADSVILVRHALTRGVTLRREDNTIINRKLIINGRPNYAIVKQKVVLNGTQIDSLINILTQPNYSNHLEIGKCFIPHHSIFIIKNGKTSFIDLCFSCRNFDTSKDINLEVFEPKKWEVLYNYFESLGFIFDVDITE